MSKMKQTVEALKREVKDYIQELEYEISSGYDDVRAEGVITNLKTIVSKVIEEVDGPLSEFYE